MVTEINLPDIYSTALTVTATIITLLFTLRDSINKRFKNPELALEPAQYFSIEGSSASWWNDAAEINLCGFIIVMGSILVFLLALGLAQSSPGSAIHIGANTSIINGAALVEGDFSGEAKVLSTTSASGKGGMSNEVNIFAESGSSNDVDVPIENGSAKLASASGEKNVSGEAGMSIEANSSSSGMMLDTTDESNAASTPTENNEYQSPNSSWPKLEVPEFLYATWLVWLFFCILFMSRLSFSPK